jgi:hypothetical protein
MSPRLVASLKWPFSVFFSRHRHSFQPASAFFVLAQRPSVRLNHLAGARE